MKKIISTLLSLALVIGICPILASAETTLAGTGVEGDPYIISNAAELKAARDMINADTDGTGARVAHYEVTADIDLENELWTPIAPCSSFKGSFDGNEHVIRNVNIEMNADNYTDYASRPALAFFGYTEDAVIKDLGLDGVSVVNKAPYVSTSWQCRPTSLAGFVGSVNRDVKISNCFVKNATIAQKGVYAPVGGFYGTGGGSQTPTFTNCYVYNATISGKEANDKLGGFGGTQNYAKISHNNCYTAQTVTTPASTAITSFYAFSFKGSTGTEVSNCYAEADDIAAANYDSSKVIGTTGMTKDGLVEAMTAVGYATDASVNNGYPCLAWEVPEPELWNGVAAESFAEGSGKIDDPYKIYTAAELKLAAETVNNQTATWGSAIYFSLENDIDYEGNHWTPIGISNTSDHKPFTGGFDGNEHVVKNLSVTTVDGKPYRYCGFFGYTLNAEIKDLGIENIQISLANLSTAKSEYIGAFAGRLSSSTISNCYVKNALVKQTASSGTESSLAGFVARLAGGSITNCYVYDVDLYCGYGRTQVGFAAYAGSNAVITNCYADATATRASSTTHPWYGFGWNGSRSTAYEEGTTATTTNCYSTLADANVYTDTEFGTTGQSVAQIAAAFTNLEGWQDGENINGGLPALAWEPAVVITPYVVNSVSLAKGTVTLTINKADTTGDQVCVAAYDSNGRLISAEFKPVATTVTTTVPANGAATVKVFIWNNNNPVIDAVVKNLY